tara:strand:+ start:42 stop:491 length:450 start_codon:yes stop_codon:yes gene_type:complete
MSSWQDPEYRREYNRQNYLKNKDKIRKRRVERYWEDVEYSRQKSKEYRQNNIEYYVEYQRKHSEYFKKRYYEKLSESMEKLGGKCVKCGATERLEFDHIDPKNKSFEITRGLLMGDREKFQEELDKCQLLCYDCHLEKTKQSYLNGEFK